MRKKEETRGTFAGAESSLELARRRKALWVTGAVWGDGGAQWRLLGLHAGETGAEGPASPSLLHPYTLKIHGHGAQQVRACFLPGRLASSLGVYTLTPDQTQQPIPPIPPGAVCCALPGAGVILAGGSQLPGKNWYEARRADNTTR